MNETPAIQVASDEGISVAITVAELRDEIGSELMDQAIETITLRKVCALRERMLAEHHTMPQES